MGNYIYEHSYLFEAKKGEVTVIYKGFGQSYYGANQILGSSHDVYIDGSYHGTIRVPANKRGGIGRSLKTIKNIVKEDLGILAEEKRGEK